MTTTATRLPQVTTPTDHQPHSSLQALAADRQAPNASRSMRNIGHHSLRTTERPVRRIGPAIAAVAPVDVAAARALGRDSELPAVCERVGGADGEAVAARVRGATTATRPQAANGELR